MAEDKQKIEQLFLSQADVKELQKKIHEDVLSQFTNYGNKIFRNMKLWTSLIIIIFVIIITATIVFMMMNKKLNPIDIKTTIAKYGLLESSAEFKYIELDVNTIVDYFSFVISKYRPEYIKKYKKMSAEDVEQFVSLIYRYEKDEGIPYYFSLAIVAVESQFDKDCKGACGEFGLWQMMPYTFKSVNREKLSIFKDVDIKNVFYNTQSALKYITHYKNFMKDIYNINANYQQMCWLYNASPDCVIKAILQNDLNNLPIKTIEYANKVLFYYSNYSSNNFSVWYYEKFYTNGVYEKLYSKKKEK